MQRPCEHVGGHQSMVGDKIRGSARMRTQVINLRLVTRHDVAGSEAEGNLSAASKDVQCALFY